MSFPFLKQVTPHPRYTHKDGRMSALELVTMVTDKLPKVTHTQTPVNTTRSQPGNFQTPPHFSEKLKIIVFRFKKSHKLRTRIAIF